MGLIAGGLLAGALFFWAWQQVESAQWTLLWRSVPNWGWLVAALLWSSSFLLRALRLQQEWRWKHKAKWHEAMRVVVLHTAAVLLLPLRAGELGYPLLVKKLYGASMPEALRSLMWLRLQDAMVLLTMALLLWPDLALGWRLLALPGLVMLILPKLFWQRIVTFRHPQMTRWGFCMKRCEAVAGGWLSLGNWLIKITVVAVLMQAMAGPPLGLGVLQAMAAALGGELAALIPLQGPGGLGTYEAGVWVASGLPLSAAPLLGLIALQVHAFCLAVSLCLAGVWCVFDVHAKSIKARVQV
jgi:hypothetical protein